MAYIANEERYSNMVYNKCGKSGLKLPAISLGLWQNFGEDNSLQNIRAMIHKAFDLGITHFDLANNYGPPAGSAEENFGRVLSSDLKAYRDELIISSKAGFDMWPGPYGDWGSKKYLIASLDQSLTRLGLDYVDIFYHHRFDPETPLEETMMALDQIVRQGKALYVGLSNYGADELQKAAQILKELGTPCLITQPSYSMVNRWIEDGLQDVTDEYGIGTIAFWPLAMGLLTDKYLNGIPETSRAAHNSWVKSGITEDKVAKVRLLNEIAKERGQSMAQLAIAWVLRKGRVTSALIGASKVSQIEENVATINNLNFSDDELARIEDILK
ncbi:MULTISPECIES: L-glyceraldehyde 3-phosphate reductase [unclassified Clostridium]|uniref:L-glyceraldehyde 3-phosphate reductase n=1 Tax=unclassified Clostridium TaxID=2614128 RepID=UPI000297A281|nr:MULTISPECIES: L-glyceraldehyde 3-phosphate reductase [unclassified Clostridium]EKQ56504.1 MAG: putative oxidoreductase, aryl-alcohol dehydrogenase like protein [Clostridium sp. Maddingley MBC34-26]